MTKRTIESLRSMSAVQPRHQSAWQFDNSLLVCSSKVDLAGKTITFKVIETEELLGFQTVTDLREAGNVALGFHDRQGRLHSIIHFHGVRMARCELDLDDALPGDVPLGYDVRLTFTRTGLQRL